MEEKTEKTQPTTEDPLEEQRHAKPTAFWPTFSNGGYGSPYQETAGDLEKRGIGLL